MKKYCLITTYYTTAGKALSQNELQTRFNYDGSLDDIFTNFSDEFDPWNKDHLKVGKSGRKDLVYGKIFMLKEFIEKNILGKYEYLCHIDYNDTKFGRSFLDMMIKFENSNQDFIISTEKKCWPDIETVITWIDHPIEEKDFEYINSGAVISKTQVFYNYLLQLIDICLNIDIDFGDDQGVWQYYNLKIKNLNADKACEWFFSTAFLDSTYYSIEDKKIKTKFGTYPYLIHDNSSFSLNLIHTI